MAFWLFKTEPGTWSWKDQVNTDIEGWDGVRNHQACNNMRAMKKGDLGFFYHSVNERRIVGIVKAVKTPVTLQQIKQDSRFENFALIRQSRLSVVPVSDDHWVWICQMAGVTA